MAFSKVFLGGLLALAVASCVMAAEDMKCEYGSQSGKQSCSKDLMKDQKLILKCPAGSAMTPQDAFQSKMGKVCDKAFTDLAGACQNEVALNSIVPGINLEHPDASKKMEHMVIYNSQELKNDVMAYARCHAGDKGFVIAIKFKKGDSSSASSRWTIPAIFLGSLTSLAVLMRA